MTAKVSELMREEGRRHITLSWEHYLQTQGSDVLQEGGKSAEFTYVISMIHNI